MNSDLESRIVANSREGAKNARFYDQFWKIERIGLGEFEELRGNLIRTSILQCVSKRPLRILDIGCGYGWLAWFLGDLGTYFGVDFSRKAIDYAQFVYGDHGQFSVADPDETSLGVAYKEFDVVVASEVIEHVPDHEAFVEQLGEFLKPNGLLLITTPNGYLYEIIREQRGANMQPVENWLTPNHLTELFSEQFRLVQHRGILYRQPRYGPRSYLISHKLRRLFQLLRQTNVYERILLRNCIYQFAVFEKI